MPRRALVVTALVGIGAAGTVIAMDMRLRDGLLVVMLCAAATVYVMVNAQRSTVLQERLLSAGRLKDQADALHLTQLQQAEERLVRSEKLVTVGQLAAGIAHEIGTPLNVARGRAELTLARLGVDHPQAGSQRAIIEQIDRVITLIRHLLDYVHPATTAIQAVPVVPAIRAVIDLLEVEATKRKITLHLDVPASETAILADPGQLQQVLVNLVMNAIDACDPGGRVEVRAALDGKAVLLEVIDDGAGIPSESRARVFDPFFTTKKRGQGTGLGLWVVAELVRAHSADIQVLGRPGAGTTFQIKWPAAKPDSGTLESAT